VKNSPGLNAGNFDMLAQTMAGLEEILAGELSAIGALEVVKRNRAVSFRGDRACMYRANLCCRTALRILVPIHVFSLKNEEDLYRAIKAMPWEDHLDVDDTLAVHCTLSSALFTHSHYLALKAKDAIADRFRERTGRRPSVDLDDPTLHIQLFVHGDRCTVSLDSSGGSLHRRGYRERVNITPMNEVLAAGLVLLSGWDRSRPLVDPMCGTGTIPIEAAMIAAGIPPGYHRDRFGFEAWKDFDRKLWQHVFDEAVAGIDHEHLPLILGADLSPHVARKAGANVASADLKDRVTIRTSAFADLEPPAESGVLILDPPYGERMDKDEDINALYKMIGDTLKKRWTGWEAWILTANLEAAKHIHLTARPRIPIYNGPLECRFMRYELYGGTRRTRLSGDQNMIGH